MIGSDEGREIDGFWTLVEVSDRNAEGRRASMHMQLGSRVEVRFPRVFAGHDASLRGVKYGHLRHLGEEEARWRGTFSTSGRCDMLGFFMLSLEEDDVSARDDIMFIEFPVQGTTFVFRRVIERKAAAAGRRPDRGSTAKRPRSRGSSARARVAAAASAPAARGRARVEAEGAAVTVEAMQVLSAQTPRISGFHAPQGSSLRAATRLPLEPRPSMRPERAAQLTPRGAAPPCVYEYHLPW